MERELYEQMLAEDAEMVEALRSGGKKHTGVEAQLYKRYRNQVSEQIRSALYKWNGNQEDLYDLIHEAFILMLKKIRIGGYKSGSLLHFWTGIAKGLLSNKLKRDWKLDLTDDELSLDGIEPTDPEGIYLDSERKAAVHELLSNIGDRCRKVLLLWMENYSMQEIADELSISSDAMTRKIKHQCLKKLRTMVQDKHTQIRNRIL